MKSFMPKICPECQTPLTIEYGKKEGIIKLVCPNKECSGTALKKLEKGIIALEIRGIGPSTIESLSLAGIESSVDLFDKSKMNEEVLCDSGQFKKGRDLEKMLIAINNTKEIPISKAILSLQIKDIGKSLSEKIGQLLSGLNPDFTSQLLSVRADIELDNSEILHTIEESIKKFESFGVKIIRYEPPKPIDPSTIKKVNKTIDTTIQDISIFSQLNWGIVDVKDPSCQMLVVNDKNEINEKIEYAKNNGVKIMTLQQIKLLFL